MRTVNLNLALPHLAHLRGRLPFDGPHVVLYAHDTQELEGLRRLGVPEEYLTGPALPVAPASHTIPAAPATPPKPPQPVPYTDWPLYAKALGRLRHAGDKGLGDTAARCIARLGGKDLAWLYTKVTGKPCGCGDRQAKLNAMYPFSP